MQTMIFNSTTRKTRFFKTTEAMVRELKRYGQRGYRATFVHIHGDGSVCYHIIRKNDPKSCLFSTVSDTPGYQCVYDGGKFVVYQNEVI